MTDFIFIFLATLSSQASTRCASAFFSRPALSCSFPVSLCRLGLVLQPHSFSFSSLPARQPLILLCIAPFPLAHVLIAGRFFALCLELGRAEQVTTQATPLPVQNYCYSPRFLLGIAQVIPLAICHPRTRHLTSTNKHQDLLAAFASCSCVLETDRVARDVQQLLERWPPPRNCNKPRDRCHIDRPCPPIPYRAALLPIDNRIRAPRPTPSSALPSTEHTASLVARA